MNKQSRRVALCGMMAALGVIAMLLGGVIPAMTYCAPAVAGLALLPVLYEYGRKWALSAYLAIAALSLILSADKESALLFAFLGYYPVLKVSLDRIKARPLRILAKLGVFNLAIAAMGACMLYLFGMTEVMAEYAEMTRAMLILFILLANGTLLLYDVLLAIVFNRYHRRFKKGKR